MRVGRVFLEKLLKEKAPTNLPGLFRIIERK